MPSSARSAAGQQLLQLRNRLGGGRSGSTSRPSSSREQEQDSALAPPVDAVSGHEHIGSDPPADEGAAAASAAASAAADVPAARGSGSTSGAVYEVAVVKPSQSLSTRQKGSRKHKSKKHHKRQKSIAAATASVGSSSASARGKGGGGGGGSNSGKKASSKSGRRTRPSRSAGPGKEGRQRRSKKDHRRTPSEESFRSHQQNSETSASASASASAGISTAFRPSAALATAAPPLSRSYSDHTQVTGTGTLTTAVSTRQATVEGMSHQGGFTCSDGLSHSNNSELLTCEMASQLSLSEDHQGVGLADLGLETVDGIGTGQPPLKLDDLDDDENGTNTLAIHTFPACRGRSLEAPAPFDERGADAMRRYRQSEEDEYLTDESSEVVVPLHWPKARRPSVGGSRKQHGFAVVSYDNDLGSVFGDEDVDREDQSQRNENFLKDDTDEEDNSNSKLGAVALSSRPASRYDDEVTGEEIEVEVQGATSSAVITTQGGQQEKITIATSRDADDETIDNASSEAATADADVSASDVPSGPSTAKKAKSKKKTKNKNRFSRPPLRLPLNISIGRRGDKTPTDHAFSAAAVLTPEHHQIDSHTSLVSTVNVDTTSSASAATVEPSDVVEETIEPKEKVTVADKVTVATIISKAPQNSKLEDDDALSAQSPTIAPSASSDDSEGTPPGLVPFSPPLPTRASSFPNLHTRAASLSALPKLGLSNPLPFSKAQSFGAHSAFLIGSNTTSAWKSWNAAAAAAAAAISAPIPHSIIATMSPISRSNSSRCTPTTSDHGSVVHVHRPGSVGYDKKYVTSIIVDGEQEIPAGAMAIEGQRALSSGAQGVVDENGSTPLKMFRLSPDGSTASTVKIRTLSKARTEEPKKFSSLLSPGDATEPTVASISFQISPDANRYVNPKLDDGKLYSEHPHDEAPSPSQSSAAAAASPVSATSPTPNDIFRSENRVQEDDSGRSEFPKIAPSSSSGSHSLPAVLSPAYKFAPIESPYSDSEAESCSGEESNYENESESDGDSPLSKEEGKTAARNDECKPSPEDRSGTSTSTSTETPLDESTDIHSSRYESFAKSGTRALMRNLTPHDDSSISVLEDTKRPRCSPLNSDAKKETEVVSEAQQGNAQDKKDEFPFSLSDIPSLVARATARCIGDIGEYYDANHGKKSDEKPPM